jgi:hypothetical protein
MATKSGDSLAAINSLGNVDFEKLNQPTPQFVSSDSLVYHAK